MVRVPAFVRTSAEQHAVHLMYIEAIGPDCQPLVLVGIRAPTATIECQMIGCMLGQAPVADEFRWQTIVARMGAAK